MRTMAEQLLSFLKRDLITTRSYRFSFLMQIIGIGSGLFTYFFLGQAVGDQTQTSIQQYGGSYFGFVLIGVAFWGLLGTSMMGALRAIQAEQRNGTMEALLVTPVSPWVLVLGGSLMPLILAVVELLLYLTGGAVFFQLDWSKADWVAVVLLLVLTTAQGSALGQFIAAFIILVKRGEAASWIPVSILGLLTGIFYPVEVLPAALQSAANLVPLTYALKGLRQALFGSASTGSLWLVLLMLVLTTAALGMLGAWALNRALALARAEGSLARF